MMSCEDFVTDKPNKWQNNCPLLPLLAECKKHKKCCKSFKKGDRCKKCPGKKS